MRRSVDRQNKQERGAVAVELALVAPFLLALIVAIVEFSNAYNIQVSVTQASREAARTMAITNDAAIATAAGIAGAPSIDTDLLSFDFSAATCATATATAIVSVTYSGASLTGVFGPALNLTGQGAMQCGG